MDKIHQSVEVHSDEIKFLREGQSLHHALLQDGTQGSKTSTPIRSYDGDRDDKVLDNFFWDVEEYLSSTPKLVDEAQVRKVALCFTGSMKLWWQTYLADERDGKAVRSIKNWLELKVALQDQFYPGNLDWVA